VLDGDREVAIRIRRLLRALLVTAGGDEQREHDDGQCSSHTGRVTRY
jgi:hypothetical protein